MDKPPTPPSCSECATKSEAPGGIPPTQSSSRMWRSSSGKMRIDTPSASIISSPADKKTILLDHLKKRRWLSRCLQQLELRHLEVPKSRADRQRLLRCRYKIWAKAGSKGMKSKENVMFFRRRKSLRCVHAEASSDAQASAVAASNWATQAAAADRDRGVDQRQAENARAD
jgi:hypothetical protein